MLYNIVLLHKKVIMLPFMESNALHYFLHYFLSPGLGLLICFLIIIKKKIFWSFHTKSEINKPQAEGSASVPHSRLFSAWGQERCQ